MSSSLSEKKSKKKKNIAEVDDGEVIQSHSKKKKKLKVTINDYEECEKHSSINEEEFEPHAKINNVKQEIESEEWTKDDKLELVRRMEIQIPKNDNKSFSSRVDKLDWEQIQFGGHPAEDCFEQWRVLRSKVRHYRVLGEILHDAKTWIENPWSSTTNKKKTRHPEMPTRPLSSFMLFYMEKKNKIIKRHPELKLTDISRMIGERYKSLSEEKKAYYVEKARIMQEEYKQNLLKFYEKYPELMRVNKKKLAQTNKPLPPIKLYLNDKLHKHQSDDNFNKHDFLEKYKDAWKHLSFKKKAFWIRLAKDEEEKYLEHLNEEQILEGDKPSTSYKSVISKDENAILDRLAGKPEKPPNSAYSLFSRLMLQDKDVDGEPKNRMREIAIKWKEISDEQKKTYAERVQHMHENYKLEFANYLESLPEEKRAEELAKLQPKKKPPKARQKTDKKRSGLSDSQKQDLFKNEPEKPPVTAWDLFKNEFMKKNGHLPSKDAYKQAAAMWKNLSRKETERYKRKHEQLKDKYMVDFEAFLKTLNEDELKEYSALKTAKSGEDELNDDSLEEESSSPEDGNSSENSSNSSEESDSGVSEEAF